VSVIWNKVWYDLRHNLGRTALVVLSIAAGVFTLGGIFGMVDQLLAGMDRAHQEIAPSHINIILRNYVDQSVVDELRSVPGVRDIDPVNQISVRYRSGNQENWNLGTLVERPDYENQIFDIISLKEGTWPQNGQLAIERLSSQHYGYQPGDSVTFQVNGEEKTYKIEGKVRHPFVQPPPFGGQAHFFTDAAGLEQFGVPQGYFGQLLVQVENYSLSNAQAVAGEIRSRLADQGVGVVVSLYQDPEKHWGRMFVEGITLVLRVIALVSLFLSVVLVLNTLTAVITQQTDQIGVIKAIGGTSGRIAGIYFVLVLTYGLLALMIALPASVLFAFYMSQWFLNLFNIDYYNFVVSPGAIVLTLLAALVAPVLAALWPVLRGAAISVREAISTYGLGGDFGSSKFDRWIESLGARFLSTVYSAALGNMFRRKGRLILTLTVLSTAGIMFLIVMSLISSIELTLDNEMARTAYDARIGFTQNQSIPEVLALIEDVPGVESAELWYSRNATILRSGERLEDSAGLGAQLIGIPDQSQSYRPVITAGRWLKPGDRQAIVISQDTADKNNIAVGDTISLDLGELGMADWQVVGTYRSIYGTGFLVEPIYAALPAVADVSGELDQGTQLIVAGKNIQSLEQENNFSDSLKTRLEEAGIQIDFYTTSAKLEQRAYADNQFNTIVSMLINLAVMMGLVGGIGLMGALGISVVERTREIGVLRAIGSQTGQIRALFIMEGALQGVLSFMLALPLAYLLAQPMARLLGQRMIAIDLDYAFNYPALGIWLTMVIVISIMASSLPALRAAKISVRESLSYG
jgi:putative ABC transport system permease protein